MSILIKNVIVVTGDPLDRTPGKGNILVENGRIAYIGPGEKPAERVINRDGFIAMPGFINAHTHSPMVLMRNAADDLPLERWLHESIFPMEEKLTPEHIRNGTQLALLEMVECGTTAFLDMYMGADITAEAVMEAGIRANLSCGLLSCQKLSEGLEEAKSACRRFRDTYHGACNGLLQTSLELHSVYLYDQTLLDEAVKLAHDLGTRIHIHLHETQTEVENSIRKYGLSPLRQCLKTGILNLPVTAAHTVWMEDEELDIMMEYGVIPVHNPSSNMKLGSGFARIPDMIRRGIRPAIGTDGAASNNDLDMFCEMHLTGILHKGVNLDATAMPAPEVLGMATKNGAAALGFSDTGMLKEGYRADLILVNTDKPHLTPLLDPVAALVYSTKSSDVDMVMVDGNILMENRETTTLDKEKILFHSRKSAGILTGRGIS